MNDKLTNINTRLVKNEYLPVAEDNKLLALYLKSKEIGTYGSIDYGLAGAGCSPKTLLKNAVLIRQVLKSIDRPFTTLTREDMLELRNRFKLNDIKAHKWKREAGTGKTIPYEAEMSFRTKKTQLSCLKQFWQWYQEYMFREHKQEMPNIFERIRLQEPKQTEHIIDWINPDELRRFMRHIERHEDYKLFVCVSIDAAARPIEAANLRRKHFFYEDDKLFCQLPNIKGCSGRKHINEVLFERVFIERKIKDMQPDDFLFNYVDKNNPFQGSSGCYDWSDKGYKSLKARTKHFTRKVLNKPFTPYVFRKTAAMHWLRLSNNNLVWVQKRLGHVEGSDAIKHYMTLQGIKTPDCINTNLENSKFENSTEKDMVVNEVMQSNKLKMEMMQEQMRNMQQQFLNMVAQMPKIDPLEHRELIKQTIEAVRAENK
jgi:integrase